MGSANKLSGAGNLPLWMILILAALKAQGLEVPEANTSFFLGRETLVRAGGKAGLSSWRFRLFRFLTRNASSPTDFFGLPPNRVAEIGTQFTL